MKCRGGLDGLKLSFHTASRRSRYRCGCCRGSRRESAVAQLSTLIWLTIVKRAVVLLSLLDRIL